MACLKFKQANRDTRMRWHFCRRSTGCPPGRWGSVEFGQSGALEQVFGWRRIDTDTIVRVALGLIDVRAPTRSAGIIVEAFCVTTR